MKHVIYTGDTGVCSPGDVVFASFKRGTNFATLMRYDHVAICRANRDIDIKSAGQALPVYEAVDVPRSSIWPTKYEIHFLCKMYKNGVPISSGVRAAIVDTAERIVSRSQQLINAHRGDLAEKRKRCGWSLTRYKYLRPNPNNAAVWDELHFTCAGLVEHCYESAGHDIVVDGSCTSEHRTARCKRSTVPLSEHPDRNGIWIHRLYPGYQCKAFTDDTYPLDLGGLRQRGEDAADFERCQPSVA